MILWGMLEVQPQPTIQKLLQYLPYVHIILDKVQKVDIAEAPVSLAADEPLTFPTKSSAPLTDLNANDVDDLNTALSTELTCKRRLAEATFAAHSEIVPGSESETEPDEEYNNHTGAASLLDSYLPKKNN